MHDNMKSKLFNIVLVCTLGFIAYSCDKGYEYEPGKAEQIKGNENNVTIDPSTVRKIDADGSDIQILLTRTNTDEAATVSLSLTDTTGIFNLKSESVTFDAGEDSVYALVAYSYDNMDSKTTYTVELAITDESLVSSYGVKSISFTCTKAWKKLGTVQFYEGWFFGYIWEKELIQSPDGLPVYRLLQPFTKSDIEDEGYVFVKEVPYLEFSIQNDTVIIPNEFELGFVFSGYDCYFLGPNKAPMALEASVVDASNMITINWYPGLYSGGKYAASWSRASFALISLPGGPDLEEVLAE